MLLRRMKSSTTGATDKRRVSDSRKGCGPFGPDDLESVVLRRCFYLANICLLSDHARHEHKLNNSA